jgi:hypothetical protein
MYFQDLGTKGERVWLDKLFLHRTSKSSYVGQLTTEIRDMKVVGGRAEA